jgi:hypothetical protein
MPIVRLALILFAAACWLRGAEPGVVEALHFDQLEQEFHPGLTDDSLLAHYVFVNRGSAAVTITGTRTSCGCTTTTLDKTTYQPGERGEILATFDVGDHSGFQDKTIQVDNDGGPAILLHLKVFLPEPPTVTPSFVSWLRFENKDPRVVKITVPAGSPSLVTAAVSTNPAVTATLAAGDKPRTWTLTLVPTDTSRLANTMIELSTNTTRKLYVFANVIDSPSPAAPSR